MKQIIVLFLSISLFIQCQNKKEAAMPTTDFYINEQKITYKNQDLPFGKPVEEWVKIFGEYNRRPFKSVYVWDNLGISIQQSWGDRIPTDEEIAEKSLKAPIVELHIFFLNLKSPLAEEGVLDYAEGFYMKTDKDPKNYVYPLTTYSKPLNVEGAEVKNDMTISDINTQRKSHGLEPISYLDWNMNGKVESGTDIESNGYFSNYGSKNSPQDREEKHKKIFYHIMFRQTAGQVEYIRIVHDKGQEYFKY